MNEPAPAASVRPGLLAALLLLLAGTATIGGSALAGMALLGGGTALLAVGAWRENRRVSLLTRRLAELEANGRQREQELAEARGRCQQILDHAIDAMFFIDPHDGTLLEVNRRAEEMLGYSCEEVRHLSLDVLFPGRQRRHYLKLVRRILRNGSADETQLLFRRQDGSLLYCDVRARLGWLGTRRVVHGSIRDVTPNVHLAIELRRHSQHLALLNEIARRAAKGQEISSLLTTVLDQVLGTLGVSGGGIVLLRHQGTEMDLAFHRDIPAHLVEALARLRPGEGLIGGVAASGRPRMSVDMQEDRRCAIAAAVRDGWRGFLAVPLVADELCLGVLFVFDRGERAVSRNELRLLQVVGQQVAPLVKNAELFDELQWQHRLNQASLRELERSRAALRDNLAQLEQQHRMLQSLEQMKSTFLALASHELRTPLTVICSGAELLQAGTTGRLDEEGRRALAAIVNGSRRLRDMVDDLLEAARLEAKAVYLAREDFDPGLLCEELVAAFQPLCDQRRLNCTIGEMPAGVVARGDVYHLRRALGRLFENAVKFTPEGGWIRLEAALRSAAEVASLAGQLRRFSTGFFDAPPVDRYLEIRLCDNGVGLAPGEEELVFTRFYAGDDIASHSTSRERFGGKGFGLGLALARGLIAAHDGLLWAESAGRNQGSSFRMLLPLPQTGNAHAIG